MSKKRQQQRAGAQQPVPNNTIQFDRGNRENFNIIPRNAAQEEYLDLLTDPSKSIVFAVGPAGTGKTLLAMMAGIQAYRQGTVKRMVLTRPAVGVEGESHGFLPGDLNSKMAPWTQPLFDVIRECYTNEQIEQMIQNQIIELAPLAMMRGRTFKHSWIIADEMQNATPAQMKMLLTRIGDGSKIILTGDLAQTDRKASQNGLLDFKTLVNQVGGCRYVSGIEFTHAHIERHPAVSEILRIYGETD
jgi:phosphate starvation-inducible protein PhoH and related proteins